MNTNYGAIRGIENLQLLKWGCQILMPGDTDDVERIKQKLTDNPSEEFLDSFASAVVDQMEESFPELSFNIQSLEETIDSFREKKLRQVKSKQQYSTKIDYISEYFHDEVGAETTEDLTSNDIERYKNWRKFDSLDREDPLKKSTLSDDMYLFEEFVEYMIEHHLVPARFVNQIEHPDVRPEKGEGVSDKKLDPELANAALDYLRKYHYADVDHVTMELLCQLGPRRRGIVGRDLSDFKSKDGDKVLTFFHTESESLKNDEGSNRDVTLYGDLPKIIQDYIDGPRPNVTDSEGNKPLLTKGNGRIGAGTVKKISYMWTRPCQVGLECPHDKDPDDCEAAQKNNSAYKCPSSRAPHHIRTGFITDNRNAGVSPAAIDQRCDVSPHTQERYYDLPDRNAERERYDDEFRDREPDSNSGYRQ